MGEAKPRSVVPGGEFEGLIERADMQPDGATGEAGITVLDGAGARDDAVLPDLAVPTIPLQVWPQGRGG